jgi:dCMP deaminase
MTELLQSPTPLGQSLMRLATQWACDRSKDPKTKVGAVLYNHFTGEMFLGYNGMPKGMPETAEVWERPTKYDYVIHAEENALTKMLMATGGMRNNQFALYCTHSPCPACTLRMGAAGITTICYNIMRDDLAKSWEIAGRLRMSMMLMSL